MSPAQTRVILFANGDLPNPDHISPMLRPDDVLIAVDGGLQHLTRLQLIPQWIIGDLDSADPQEVKRLGALGVAIRRFPTHKDESDLELALLAALEWHPDVVWVIGAIGGRLDQTLANIFLLMQPKLAALDLRMVDGLQEVFLVRQAATIHGKPGQRVSLLPLMGPSTGVETSGLAYPLRHETLYPDKTRGISNQMIGDVAEVRTVSGILLCIHTLSHDESE